MTVGSLRGDYIGNSLRRSGNNNPCIGLCQNTAMRSCCGKGYIVYTSDRIVM